MRAKWGSKPVLGQQVITDIKNVFSESNMAKKAREIVKSQHYSYMNILAAGQKSSGLIQYNTHNKSHLDTCNRYLNNGSLFKIKPFVNLITGYLPM